MNKKVKNVQGCSYNGIDFKSQLERDTYIALLEAGFNPEYEKRTYILQDTKHFPTLHYAPYKDRKLRQNVWGLNTYKMVSIKYKPDFTFYVKDKLIVIENKGYANDRYMYQKKLLFKWLEENQPNSAFFEIHNKKQLNKSIEILKEWKV